MEMKRPRRYRILGRLLDASLLVCFLLGAGCSKESPVAAPDDDALVTVERELTEGEQPAVSPDGRKIAFTRNGDIFVCDTSGAQVAQLTSGLEQDIQPRWHPNGQTIGFIRKNDRKYNEGLLFDVPSNGGAATLLVADEFVADSLIQLATVYEGIGMPIWDWSPTGLRVAFLQQTGAQSFLKMVLLSNRQQKHVVLLYDANTSTAGNGSGFVWSADEEIAFLAQNPRRDRELCLLNLATNELLKDSSHFSPLYLTKDPLSRRFAYFASFGFGFLSGFVVTDLRGAPDELISDGYGPGLLWSPDGRCLLFENPRYVGVFQYRESRLAIFDLERRKRYQITQEGDIDRRTYFFDWGKSSREVFFERYRKICVVRFQLPK
jgi:hypothetical protein